MIHTRLYAEASLAIDIIHFIVFGFLLETGKETGEQLEKRFSKLYNRGIFYE